jgi:protein TonB
MASARVVNTIPLWRRGSARPLPPRGCSGARSRRQGDERSTAACCSLLVAIVALHGLALYGLMQVGAVREAVREAAPIFAELIRPPAAPPAVAPAAAAPPPTPA